jgi:glycerol-3-phosphate acyltransferase PlsY
MGNLCCAEFNSFANLAVSLNVAAAEPVFNIATVILIAYLLGSINFSYLIYKKKTGKDIRTVGSKNPGASNIRRFLGWKYYLLVLILDILKGLIAVLIADWFTGGDIAIVSIAGAAAIIGHSYPFWLGFKGGKSVAVTIGVFIPIGFWAVLIFAASYFSLVGIFKIVSIASLMGAFLLAAATFLFGYPLPVKLLAIFSLLLIVYRHRSNIIRLIRKEELGYSTTKIEDE